MQSKKGRELYNKLSAKEINHNHTYMSDIHQSHHHLEYVQDNDIPDKIFHHK